MRNIRESHLHPDVLDMGNTKYGSIIELKKPVTEELDELESIKNNATSSSELYWVEQKKLELFQRVFGF